MGNVDYFRAMDMRVGDVLKLVVKSGVMLTLIGVAIGLGLSLALTRLMTSLLFGVKPTDGSDIRDGFACPDDRGLICLLRAGATRDKGRSTRGTPLRVKMALGRRQGNQGGRV